METGSDECYLLLKVMVTVHRINLFNGLPGIQFPKKGDISRKLSSHNPTQRYIVSESFHTVYVTLSSIVEVIYIFRFSAHLVWDLKTTEHRNRKWVQDGSIQY